MKTRYEFKYSNKANGYTSDLATIKVTEDGVVNSLQFKFLLPDLKLEDVQVSKVKQDEIITQKMKDMHDTKNMKYLSHEIDTTTLTMCDEEVCIEYGVLVNILPQNSGIEVGYRCRILIPLRLLSEN